MNLFKYISNPEIILFLSGKIGFILAALIGIVALVCRKAISLTDTVIILAILYLVSILLSAINLTDVLTDVDVDNITDTNEKVTDATKGIMTTRKSSAKNLL